MNYKAKLVPMEKVGYKHGDILITRQGEVTIATGTTGKVCIKKPQRLVITSDKKIKDLDWVYNEDRNEVYQFIAGMHTKSFPFIKKAEACYPQVSGHCPPPQIDLSDIRRWIDDGCKESVELEIKERSFGITGDYTVIEPTLTNNTVKMVFEAERERGITINRGQDKAQPIAGVVDKVVKELAHDICMNCFRGADEMDYKEQTQEISDKIISRLPLLKHHPTTDWDALEDKFNKWYSNQPTSVTGIDIFNFFKNELTK